MDSPCCLLKLQPLHGLGPWFCPSFFCWVYFLPVYEVLPLPTMSLRYDLPSRHPFYPNSVLQRNHPHSAYSPDGNWLLAPFISATILHAPLAGKP